MKTAISTKFGPPDVLHLQEVDKPAPKANEVLIKIHATSVVKEDPDMRASPGFNGLLSPRHAILGQELAGEIASVGAAVTRFKPGDQVYGIDQFGAYAEYKRMPENGALARKPANLTYAEAASIPNGALTALPYLRDQGKVRSGQTVLIYGASGAIGSAAVQLARYFGAQVTGVCSTANLAWVQALGANTVIDYTQEDFTERDERYDLILNAVGKSKAQLSCQQALTPNGQHITVDDGSPKMQAEGLLFLHQVIEAGKMKAVIDRCYPLDQIV